MTDKEQETEAEMVARRGREEALIRDEHRIDLDAALALPRGTPVEEQMRARAIQQVHVDYKRDVRKMVDRHQTEEIALRMRLNPAHEPSETEAVAAG